MGRDGEDLLARAPQVHGGLEPAVAILEAAVHIGSVEFADRAVRERERPRVQGLRPRARERGGGADRPAHARGVLLQQRIQAREREALDLQVRVGPAPARHIPLQQESPRPVDAHQGEARDPGGRVRHHDFDRAAQHPDVARDLERERVHGHGRGVRAAHVAAPRENRTDLADARAGEPGERVPGPRDARRGGAEAALAQRERIERHLPGDRGHRTGPVRHAGAPRRHLPLAPPQALQTRPRLDRERVECALERHRDPRRARERATPAPALSPERTARHPGDQRVDRVEAVRVEVQAQRPARRPRPSEHAAARRDQPRLRQAQRIHVHAAVGEAQARHPAVQARAREQRGPERGGDRPRRCRAAVGADTPGERSAEPRRWSGGRREPAREIKLPGADGGVPGAKPRRQQRQHTVHLDAAAVLRGLQVGVRRQRRQRAVDPHRARHRARERQPPAREAPAQAIERERVRDHVGEHRERVAAAVEPHDAADHARG